MKYKGYTGRVEYDDDSEIFHGEVLGIRDVVTFQGKSVSELKKAFRDSIDDYLDFCGDRGEQPDRPTQGKLLIRVDPLLHRQMIQAAASAKQSLNSWIADRLASSFVKRTQQTRTQPTRLKPASRPIRKPAKSSS